MTEENRVIDLSVEVPGTPEQVWEAIATGPGITSWFVPHTVEGRPGGAVQMDFGPEYGTVTARVGSWEPPRRLVLQSEGEHGLAHEWLVEPRSESRCVVRLVVSHGFGTGGDPDAEYDGMSTGWRLFLENLRLHCERFPGRAGRAVIPSKGVPGPLDDAFARLCAELGVPADLADGDPFRTSGAGAPALTGTVDRVLRLPRATSYVLLLDEPAAGHGLVAAEGTADAVTLSLYLYLYGERAAELPDTVTPFLASRFRSSGQSA